MPYAHPIAGIYMWLNTMNGYRYIGSSVNLQQRRSEHLRKLRCNIHNNPHLQRAFNLYKETSFVFQVLEEVPDVSILLAREQFHIDTLSPEYNILQKAGNSLGFRHSTETLKKMRGHSRTPSNKGKNLSEKHRKMISTALNGKSKDEATCLNMSKAKKGKPLSEKGKSALLVVSEKWKKSLIVTSPDGTEYLIHGIRQFCKEHSLNAANLRQVAQGKQKQHKGWTARYAEPDAS